MSKEVCALCDGEGYDEGSNRPCYLCNGTGTIDLEDDNVVELLIKARVLQEDGVTIEHGKYKLED